MFLQTKQRDVKTESKKRKKQGKLHTYKPSVTVSSLSLTRRLSGLLWPLLVSTHLVSRCLGSTYTLAAQTKTKQIHPKIIKLEKTDLRFCKQSICSTN